MWMMPERGPGACQDSCPLLGVGTFQGGRSAHQQPPYRGFSKVGLSERKWRILPPDWGGLEGWWSLVCFFGSLRTKYSEQFLFSSQMWILYRHLESEDPELRDVYLVYSYINVSLVNYHCEVLPLSSFFFLKILKWWKYNLAFCMGFLDLKISLQPPNAETW